MFGGAKGEIRKTLSIDAEAWFGTHRVGAESYGNCLVVSRYLTFYSLDAMPDPDLMDIFELEKLVVFNSVAQHAVTDAVKSFMKEIGLDYTDMDTKSKGYLEVW